MLIHLPALVAALTVALMLVTAILVGRARTRYGIHSPAISGHPAFERAWRVQMNTLEAAVMFLPSLWLATRYGIPGMAGALGVLWLLARAAYVAVYLRDPSRRGPAFGLGMLAMLALWLMGLLGVLRAMWRMAGAG